MQSRLTIALLAATLGLACAAAHAQQAPKTLSQALADGDTAALARLGQSIADSTQPLLLEASAAFCVPVIEQDVNFYIAVEAANAKLGFGKKIPATLQNMPHAWAQNGQEYTPSGTPGVLGTYRDTGTYAVLHAGVGAHGVCTVAWQITDIEKGGDPHDEAKRLYEWISQLDGFTLTEQSRDGARWDNTRSGTFLSMTSNEDDVIFLHYGHR